MITQPCTWKKKDQSDPTDVPLAGTPNLKTIIKTQGKDYDE